MPWNNRADLTAGPVSLPGVQWSVGALYDRGPRAKKPGWGAAVELPAVLELLEHIADGTVTPEQAAAAFGPVHVDLAQFNQEAGELERLMGDRP